VARGTNVPQVANQIIKATQEVLTDELGLQIAGQPEVRVTVVHDKGVEVETAPPPPPTTYRPEPVVEEESAEAPPPLPYDTPEAEEEEADEGQETDVA
jgi:hypothetical protein